MTVCRPDLLPTLAPRCPPARLAEADPGAEPEPEALQPLTASAITALSAAIVPADVVPELRVTSSPGVFVGQ
jgi:hypothetical protein